MLRIFDTGAVARGYSTSPIWVSNKNVLSSGQNKGKSGRAKSTSYFKGGYKEYKAAMNFDNSKVNFRLTNNLQMDLSNATVNPQTGSPTIGQVIEKSKFLYVEEIRSDENVKKLDGLRASFGDFVSLTDSDKQMFTTILNAEITAMLKANL